MMMMMMMIFEYLNSSAWNYSQLWIYWIKCCLIYTHTPMDPRAEKLIGVTEQYSTDNFPLSIIWSSVQVEVPT